ncbi:hypothetical protein HZA39_03880 [Candidatus Peregrinibacteria bacterium]|nr:hypothetical protein [Candidatus Peregrinibacteria bacterium]
MPTAEQLEQKEKSYAEKYPALAAYLNTKQASRLNKEIPERLLKTKDRTAFIRSEDDAEIWVSKLFNDLSITMTLEQNKKEFSPESAIKGLMERLRRFVDSGGSSEEDGVFKVEESLFEDENALDDFVNLIYDEIQSTSNFLIVAGYNKETQEYKYTLALDVRAAEAAKS